MEQIAQNNRKTVVLGCGYIGKALLSHWKKHLHNCGEITATTTRIERISELHLLADKIVVVEGNDFHSMKNLLRKATHLVICVAPRTQALYRATYLETAQTVIDALTDQNYIEQIVYTSSTSVYGENNGEWVTETSELKPLSDTSEILCETEKTFLKAQGLGARVTILRLAGIYGPDREIFSMAKRFSGKIYPGDGRSFCNWTHQQDIVRAIDWCILNRLHGIYNICSNEHPIRRNLYENLLREANLPDILWDGSTTNPHGGNKRVSNQKIKDTGFDFLNAF